MKKNIFAIGLGLLGLASAGCSSAKKDETQLKQEIQAQAPADSPDQIMQRAAMAFSNAEGLSADQKLRLQAVYSRVYSESMKIRREMGQSKSLLFMTLAKVNYKAAEITSLKKKIITLDQRRLNLMFSALDEVQKIVGKGIEAEKIYKHFEDYEIPNRRIRDVEIIN